MNRTTACTFTLIGALLAGCTSTSKTTTKNGKGLDGSNTVAAEPNSAIDPCAMRMHDISGALLFFYMTHKRLPATLDELQSMPALDEPLAFSCPVSKLPYIYTPEGILLPEKGKRIVLYDASPSHEGPNGPFRWAIRIDDPAPGQALVAEPISLPEQFFLLRPPQASTPIPQQPAGPPQK